MSGVFGAIFTGVVNKENVRKLAAHSRQRGFGASGLVYNCEKGYRVARADYDITEMLRQEEWSKSTVVMGHSSKAICGLKANQLVVRDGIFLIHDGIILNDEDTWKARGIEPHSRENAEVIIGIALEHLNATGNLIELSHKIMETCEGTLSGVLAVPALGKALLISNNGGLYVGESHENIYFASERYPLLNDVCCHSIRQVQREGIVVDIPTMEMMEAKDYCRKARGVRPARHRNVVAEEAILEYQQPTIKRCTRCILPETMPFITFDSDGVCNYCHSYIPRNTPKPKEQLFELVEPYRRNNEPDCVVPFSGGRDSCYALHLIVNELGMTPITYTYDWGMITDLGYKNISRMCSKLGVENIVVAADVTKKRRNIAKNLKAWLRAPHLGMISILTAGDKHFFRHVETVKKQTGIALNLWGINPLEVTHFKSGFLGIAPDFEEKKVYTSNFRKQFQYQRLRLGAMFQSPGYFNNSLWDTLSGEYYRSFVKKKDYFHLFDYWLWDERAIDATLGDYGWELAPDTTTTWRIGDGTAGFYNYVYYTVAGFSEHDTFRSNQIREGQITRREALELVKNENMPRYSSIRWYLDSLGFDFHEVISIVNSIPKLYGPV